MTLDLGSIRFDMDATPLTQGAAQAGRALEDLGKSAERAKRPVDKLLEEISQSKQRADDFIAGQRGMATSTTATGVATTLTGRQLESFGRRAASAAGSTLGLNRHLTAMMGALGPMALAGTAAAGAVALIAKELREAAEAAEAALNPFADVVEKYLKIGEARAKAELGMGQELAQLRAQLELTGNEADRLREKLDAALAAGPGRGRDRGIRDNQIAGLRSGLLDLERREADERRALTTALAVDGEDKARIAERANRDQERILKERLATQRSYAAEQARIQAAELKALEEGMRRRMAIMREFAGPEIITGAGGSQIRTTPQQAARGRQLLAEADEVAKQTKRINDSFRDTASVMAAIAPQQARYNEALSDHQRALFDQIFAAESAQHAFVDLVGALGAVPDSVLRFADTLITVQANMAAARAANIGNAEFKGGITGVDALSLASAGVGIIAGIISSARQAEIEAARMKQAQSDFTQSLQAIADSIGPRSTLQRDLLGFAQGLESLAKQAADSRKVLLSGSAAGYTTENIAERRAVIEAELKTAVARRAALQRELAFLGDMDRILTTIAAQAAEALRLAEQREQFFGEDVEVRRLSATGQGPEAETMALIIRQTREMTEALREGFSAATVAALAHVQALEAEELARNQAIDAILKAADSRALLFDLDAREARLGGDFAGASRFEAEAVRDRGIAEAEAMLVAGTITEELFARITRVLNNEFNAALAGVADAAQSAADALVAQAQAQEAAERAAGEDLDVRILRALGQDSDADTLQRQITRDREVASFREKGFSDEVIDKLVEAFRLEDQALARGDDPRQRGGRGAIGNAQVRDVTGITEASAVTMTAHLFSVVFLSREQLNVQRQILQRLGNVSSPQAPVQHVTTAPRMADILPAVDRGAGQSLAVTNSANGVRVTA